jgi:uncharacterized membrane protein
VLLAETTFLDVFWWMIVVFFWVMFFWVFISLVGDILRRDDQSGWAKAGWLLLLFVLPFLGALLYVIARPKVTPQDVRTATQLEAAQRAVAGVSTADELAKLGELRAQGVLNEQEYEELKRRTLAST